MALTTRQPIQDDPDISREQAPIDQEYLEFLEYKRTKEETERATRAAIEQRKKKTTSTVASILAGIVMVLIVAFGISWGMKNGMVSSNSGTQSGNNGKQSSLYESASSYKASCMGYSYEAVSRYPNRYAGKKIMVTGYVISVDDVEDESTGQYVVACGVMDDDFNIWFIGYTRHENEFRILEGDRVVFYGEYKEVHTFSDGTYPIIWAKYYDVLNAATQGG